VAGRRAYVLDLGSAHCPSPNALPGLPDVHHILWIDKETFFVLRDVATTANKPPVTFTVTFVEFNVAFPLGTFSFARPQAADAIIADVRPQPFRSANPPRKHPPGQESLG